MYAHSVPGQPPSDWEPLGTHLNAVATRAAGFAAWFGWTELARCAGLLHDIGKCSTAYQDYIAGVGAKGVDHSTAGAREAKAAYPGGFGQMLAVAIAGHHAGLADHSDLERRVTQKSIEPYAGWPAHAGPLPGADRLLPDRRFRQHAAQGFTHAFLTRMLFSCLVDADWLETEQFYATRSGAPVDRGGFLPMDALRDRLRAHMDGMAAAAQHKPSLVNQARAEVLAQARDRAGLPPGLFTLTVPTGGGKTLASLSFALEHAVRHGMRRVVYVIPFTSIIEQTAQVFREALGSEADVLEHHASFDWERAGSVAAADSEGPDGLAKLRRSAENWDAPVVVTTAVQFFESLFSNRRGRCRKLHNLAGAVIVLDEAQTLPVHLLRPSLAAIEELAENYGATVVICTATQPAWRRTDGALVDEMRRPFGLDIGPDRELAPDPQRLFEILRRVTVERLPGPVPDTDIAARFAEQAQMLCIVNSRAHARDLYDGIADLPGATHLTTLMCPRHRRAVLAQARRDLLAKRPVRLVATSLIEAGVDIDLPEVWRAAAGLDAINQAAGRCNREGAPEPGRVVLFEPAEAKPPRDLKAFWQAAEAALRRHPDPLSLAAVHGYFRELYFVRGAKGLDRARLEQEDWPILPHIAERARDLSFPFASIAAAYQLITDATLPVVVPWDDEAKAILRRVAAMDRPSAGDLRRLQQYVVGLPRQARDAWLAQGVLVPANRGMGEALLCFQDLAHYRPQTGVDLRDRDYRDAEQNIA